MRFLTLHMQNFGPYIDETVDFDDFSENPVFLISGQTGSGKTTIFDALVYALYGRTSGNERSGSDMRSKFADPTEPTVVTLTFEHADKTYQLVRQPQQLLAKKRGTGMTNSNKKPELTVFQQDEAIDSVTGVKPIQDRIYELMPLDELQFRQIVLLPQGDFRQFLDANSSDKEVLLRNLFGTQLFARWAEALKVQAKQVADQQSQQMTKANSLADQFDWQTEPEANTPLPVKLQAMRAEQTGQQAQVTAMDESAQHAYDQAQAAQQALTRGQQLAQAFTDQKQIEAERQVLAAQSDVMRQAKRQIDQFQFVVAQHALFNQIVSERTQVGRLQTAIETGKTAQTATQTTLTNLQTEQAALKKQQPTVTTWQQTRDQTAQALTKVAEYQAQRQELQTVHTNIAAIKQAAKDADQQIQVAEQTLKQTTADLDALKQADLQPKRNQLAVFAAKWQPVVDQLQNLDKNLATQQRHLETQQQALLDAQAVQEQAQAAYQQLLDQQISAQITVLVGQLSPDTPCPVCGSTDHPHPATITAEPVTAEVLEVADQNRAQAANQVTTLQTQIAEIQHTLTDIQTQQQTQSTALNEALESLDVSDFAAFTTLQATTQAAVDDQQKQLTALTQTQLETTETLNTATATKNQTTETLNHLQVQHERLVTQLASLEQLPAVKQDQQVLEQQLKELDEQLHDFDQRLTKNQTDLSAAQTQLATLSATLEANQQELARVQTELTAHADEFERALTQQELTEAEFVALNDRRDELTQLERQVADYQEAITRNQTRLATVTEQIGQQTMPDVGQLQVAAQAEAETSRKLQAEAAAVKQRWQSNQRLVDQLSQLLATNQQLLEEAAQLQGLLDVMSGTGQQKVSLERYVLQTYLQQVLSVANERFSALTNGRYQFVLHSEPGSRSANSGLEIDVYDDEVGESRSVHTLSGGESFIAALSLALALGEVIQRENGGVHVDALFVDEGFGALDTDSLAVALEALETIEGQSRLIGIISHVSELRAGIPDQLRVEPTGQGNSHIRVVHLNQ
ncbi:AAA family ATPase [Lacticaseibacillus brantae]|uniref:Nuclease SbcCD subunit C n=1 Tax=Lacticaseibacillus brantae DSM 23927 TaxID=1423727 RepID=A0A0R2AY11_9LACO|nr:SMC family ATPase [Lacticaseibacillus brantae]KRM71904.1 DNA repair ATPase SbcC [Lacticaseibacillus brantae DSM 23927]